MPLAFSTDGIVFGVFIILLAALTSGFGLFLQVYASKYVTPGHASFFNVCSITYPALLVVFDIAIATQCFGCAISYLVLIGDLMPSIVTHLSFLNPEHHRLFWILASAFVCVPLSFLKNLDSLKYTSMLGVAAIGYMSLLVIGHFVSGNVPESYKGELIYFPKSATDVFSTFSIIVFAFTGHQNMFSIINEAEDKTLSSLSTLANLTILAASVLFVVVGLCGYLTFGSYVDGNIILLYPGGFSTTLGRLCIVFMVIFSFPLMIHPARISVNNIYYWIRLNVFGEEPFELDDIEAEPLIGGDADVNANNEGPPLSTSILNPAFRKAYVVPFPDRVFYSITLIMLAVGYLAAATITSFALVLAVVGATGSTAISFILPGLFGYKLIGSESDDPSNLEKILLLLSFVLVVWGFAVMVVCLYSSLAL